MANRRRILVGIDGSPGSLAALACAAFIAEDEGARLEVVYVGLNTAVTDDFIARMRHALAGVGWSRAMPVVLVAHGDVVRVLASIAAERGFDTIIVGRRGWGESVHPRGGTIARSLTSGTGRTVLVVDEPQMPERILPFSMCAVPRP